MFESRILRHTWIQDGDIYTEYDMWESHPSAGMTKEQNNPKRQINEHSTLPKKEVKSVAAICQGSDDGWKRARLLVLLLV